MKKCEFMDDGSGNSRDYGLDFFPCKALNCAANFGDTCVSPASCEIDEEGKCTGYHPRGEKG